MPVKEDGTRIIFENPNPRELKALVCLVDLYPNLSNIITKRIIELALEVENTEIAGKDLLNYAAYRVFCVFHDFHELCSKNNPELLTQFINHAQSRLDDLRKDLEEVWRVLDLPTTPGNQFILSAINTLLQNHEEALPTENMLLTLILLFTLVQKETEHDDDPMMPAGDRSEKLLLYADILDSLRLTSKYRNLILEGSIVSGVLKTQSQSIQRDSDRTQTPNDGEMYAVQSIYDLTENARLDQPTYTDSFAVHMRPYKSYELYYKMMADTLKRTNNLQMMKDLILAVRRYSEYDSVKGYLPSAASAILRYVRDLTRLLKSTNGEIKEQLTEALNTVISITDVLLETKYSESEDLPTDIFNLLVKAESEYSSQKQEGMEQNQQFETVFTRLELLVLVHTSKESLIDCIEITPSSRNIIRIRTPEEFQCFAILSQEQRLQEYWIQNMGQTEFPNWVVLLKRTSTEFYIPTCELMVRNIFHANWIDLLRQLSSFDNDLAKIIIMSSSEAQQCIEEYYKTLSLEIKPDTSSADLRMNCEFILRLLPSITEVYTENATQYFVQVLRWYKSSINHNVNSDNKEYVNTLYSDIADIIRLIRFKTPHLLCLHENEISNLLSTPKVMEDTPSYEVLIQEAVLLLQSPRSVCLAYDQTTLSFSLFISHLLELFTAQPSTFSDRSVKRMVNLRIERAIKTQSINPNDEIRKGLSRIGKNTQFCTKALTGEVLEALSRITT